jgi:DNA-binding NtrC family response regulator
MTVEFYLDDDRKHSEATAPAVDLELQLDMPFHEAKRRIIDDFERRYLSAMLERCEQSVTELARVTGLSRQSCHRLINRHGFM